MCSDIPPGVFLVSVRRFCHYIVNLRYFDFLIMVAIGLSSLTLAMEDPVNPESQYNKV